MPAAGPKMTWNDALALHRRAHEAGLRAGTDAVPTTMVVTEHLNPFDDESPVARQYAPVTEGACGFAWISLPGTTSFARTMKAVGVAKAAYGGGYHIWVRDFGQSMERKSAYARAYVSVLREAGMQKVYAESRLD